MAGAFATGFLAGQRGYQQVLDNDRQRVLDERAAKEFARKEQEWQKADQLDADLTGLREQIMSPNASNYRMGGSPVGLKAPGQAAAAPESAVPGEMPPSDFSLGTVPAVGLRAPKAFALSEVPGSAAAPAPEGLGMRGSAMPSGGVSLKSGPSPAEEQAILAKMALRTGDVTGFNSARTRGDALAGKEETRSFIQNTQKLYAQRNDSPEAMEAWSAHVAPYTSMVSKYKGLDMDFRVNPKTGALEGIPYEGGKVQSFELNEVMPYLVQTNKLASQFGDPDTAVAELNRMTEAQRARVLADTTHRAGIASKIGDSAAKARTGDQQDQKLRIDAAEAGGRSAYYAAQAGAVNERTQALRDEQGRRDEAAKLADQYAGLSPTDQSGAVGQGLIRRFNMLNAKSGGQVSLGGSGGAKARPDLKFQSSGDGGFFVDANGYPVGRADPGMGLVPFGTDPRGDKSLVTKLDPKGIKIVSVEGQGGRPVWGYATADGRVFSTPEEALSPPRVPLDAARVGALGSFRDELRSAEQMLVAAGKSGDPKAINHWSQQVLGLRRMHQDAAASMFGKRAGEYLSAN